MDAGNIVPAAVDLGMLSPDYPLEDSSYYQEVVVVHILVVVGLETADLEHMDTAAHVEAVEEDRVESVVADKGNKAAGVG